MWSAPRSTSRPASELGVHRQRRFICYVLLYKEQGFSFIRTRVGAAEQFIL
jgi:hypothetical protein